MWDFATIQNAARVLAHEAGPGSDVILFGSYARGQASSHSDVDFLVVVPDARDYRSESVRLMRALRPLRFYPDIIVMDRRSFEDWSQVPTTLAYEARRDGKRLA